MRKCLSSTGAFPGHQGIHQGHGGNHFRYLHVVSGLKWHKTFYYEFNIVLLLASLFNKTDEIIDVKFCIRIKNINFGFYPYTDVC